MNEAVFEIDPSTPYQLAHMKTRDGFDVTVQFTPGPANVDLASRIRAIQLKMGNALFDLGDCHVEIQGDLSMGMPPQFHYVPPVMVIEAGKIATAMGKLTCGEPYKLETGKCQVCGFSDSRYVDDKGQSRTEKPWFEKLSVELSFATGVSSPKFGHFELDMCPKCAASVKAFKHDLRQDTAERLTMLLVRRGFKPTEEQFVKAQVGVRQDG
jgi:hypothetical protein